MRHRPQRRLILGAALLVASGGLGACTDDSPSDPPDDATPRVDLAFTQLLPDEGTRDALLRVENQSGADLPVTGAGLRWSGYGEFVDPQDATLAPGQTIDLQVRLPPARCDDGDEPITGIVRTTTTEIVQPLNANGQRFLRHLWQRRCEADLVRRQVTISYADDWRVGTAHGQPAALGSLLLTRGSGDLPVTVRSFRGSVLYDADLPAPVTAAPSEPTTLVPLEVLPGNRCDLHARGQATAPYTFRIAVSVGDTKTNVLVPPPVRVQELASEALDRACELRTGS